MNPYIQFLTNYNNDDIIALLDAELSLCSFSIVAMVNIIYVPSLFFHENSKTSSVQCQWLLPLAIGFFESSKEGEIIERQSIMRYYYLYISIYISISIQHTCATLYSFVHSRFSVYNNMSNQSVMTYCLDLISGCYVIVLWYFYYRAISWIPNLKQYDLFIDSFDASSILQDCTWQGDGGILDYFTSGLAGYHASLTCV